MRAAVWFLAMPTCAALACGGNTSVPDASDATAPGDEAGPSDAGSETPPDLPPVETVSMPLFDDVRIGSNPSEADFQNAQIDVDFGGPYAHVVLVADLVSSCFPFAGWKDDPPPSGQNWPPRCDAFDRNYEFTLDEPQKDGDPPAIELVRAITPFGGPEHFEVDVTDVINGRPGKHAVRVHISTWSDGAGQVSGSNGGWSVSAHLDVTPGKPERPVLAVIPLLNTYQGRMAAGIDLPFVIPPGTKAARIEYRATGHGGGSGGLGCIGPAEEFCMRKQTLKLDGQTAFEGNLWRDDCDQNCTLETQGSGTSSFQYCLQNPCGNIDSVKAPRANWCPGTMTPPLMVTADALPAAGPHTFSYLVPFIANGGGWRLSAVVVALGDAL